MRRIRRTEPQPTRRIVRVAAGGLLLLLCLGFSAPAVAASGSTSVGIRITSWPVGPAQQQATAVTESEVLAAVAATAGTNVPASGRGAPEAARAAAGSATLSVIPADRVPGEPEGRGLVLLSWE